MSLLFFLAAYLLGLITAFFIPNGQIWLTSVLLSILVMALLIFTKKNKFLNYSLGILSFTVGAANFNLNSTHLLPIAYQKGTIQLNLLEYTNKPNIFIAIPTNENWFTQSKILLDLSKDTLQSFRIGEDLFIEGIFMPLEERKNNSLVSIKCYAKKVTKQIKTTESESLAPSILQEKLSNRLNVLIKDSTESAFIKAMIWGDTHNLNFELKEQFKATGAYHLLAVSGMQISIIISCITGIGFLITFFFRKTKFFIAITLLFLVIYFAFISGGSASVWRASVMGVLSILCGLFSVQLTKTDTFISTLFITLLVFPDFLFNWGFIFSIAAIFGIYFIHPILIKKIKPSSFFLAKCAEIISITLSTQLVLFPLIWYLFKSFPIYFLISNIILVPLTTILILYILSLLIIHSIYEISPWMQEMAHHLTNKAIKINETIAQFPGAVLHLPSI
ncbi:MAG: ComEC/Rec2 family competence protein, partial [Bacteroidota bacterium]